MSTKLIKFVVFLSYFVNALVVESNGGELNVYETTWKNPFDGGIGNLKVNEQQSINSKKNDKTIKTNAKGLKDQPQETIKVSLDHQKYCEASKQFIPNTPFFKHFLMQFTQLMEPVGEAEYYVAQVRISGFKFNRLQKLLSQENSEKELLDIITKSFENDSKKTAKERDECLKNNDTLTKIISQLSDKIQLISQKNKDLLNEVGILKSELENVTLENRKFAETVESFKKEIITLNSCKIGASIHNIIWTATSPYLSRLFGEPLKQLASTFGKCFKLFFREIPVLWQLMVLVLVVSFVCFSGFIISTLLLRIGPKVCSLEATNKSPQTEVEEPENQKNVMSNDNSVNSQVNNKAIEPIFKINKESQACETEWSQDEKQNLNANRAVTNTVSQSAHIVPFAIDSNFSGGYKNISFNSKTEIL